MRLNLVCCFIVVLLVLLCIFSRQFISSAVTDTCETLRAASDKYKINDLTGCHFFLEHAEQRWTDNETIFGILLSHREIDAVLTSLAELRALTQYENCEEYDQITAALITQLSNIRKMEHPVLQNIF